MTVARPTTRRPLQFTVSPEAPRPGDTLRVEAQLPDDLEGPVSAVHFRLRCREQRVLRLVAGRSRASSTTHFDVGFPPVELAQGQRRVAAQFTPPAGAPPSHRTDCSSVTYQLDLRLCAPGHPDRSEHAQLQVWAPWLEPTPPPRAASTAPGGPQGEELVLEAALESAALAPGGELRGALTVENANRHRVRRLELSLVCIDSAVGRSRYGPARQRPLTVVVHEGQPPQGRRLPFRVRLPPDLPATTVGRRARLNWQLELRAVNRLEADTVLVLPVRVGGPKPTGLGPSSTPQPASA